MQMEYLKRSSQVFSTDVATVLHNKSVLYVLRVYVTVSRLEWR